MGFAFSFRVMTLLIAIIVKSVAEICSEANTSVPVLHINRDNLLNNSIVYHYGSCQSHSSSCNQCTVWCSKNHTMDCICDERVYKCEVHNETLLFGVRKTFTMSPLKLSDYHLRLMNIDDAFTFQLSFNAINGPVNGINCSFNDDVEQQLDMIQTVLSKPAFRTLVQVALPLRSSERNQWYNCTVFTHIIPNNYYDDYDNNYYSESSFAIQATKTELTYIISLHLNSSQTGYLAECTVSNFTFEVPLPSNVTRICTPSLSSTISSESTQSQAPFFTGIGILILTNIVTIIALLLSFVYLCNQKRKKRFVVKEREEVTINSLQPQTSNNTVTNNSTYNANNINTSSSPTNIYAYVEEEIDHHHHAPPTRVASQYEVPLDLIKQAQIPLPPPPPLYSTLDDQTELTIPNPGYATNTTTRENGEGEGGVGTGEGGTEEYSYATVNKGAKKPADDTMYNKLQHD